MEYKTIIVCFGYTLPKQFRQLLKHKKVDISQLIFMEITENFSYTSYSNFVLILYYS